MDGNEMYSVKEAVAYVGCSVSLLRLWKRRGIGPKVFQRGGLVRYRKQDLDRFIEQNSNQQ